MTTSVGDRWTGRWKMHQDPDEILRGVKDLEFTLRRISTDESRPEYAFDHTFDEESGLELDPFKDTTFIAYGRNHLPAPKTKLKSWRKTQEDKYQKKISQAFGSASANTLHLRGEKIFNDEAEALVLVLLPDSIDFFDNGTRIVDLIYLTCKTHLGIRTKRLRTVRRARVFQDGTAHGNPR